MLRMLMNDSQSNPVVLTKSYANLSKSMNLGEKEQEDMQKSFMTATSYKARKVIIKNIMCPLGYFILLNFYLNN